MPRTTLCRGVFRRQTRRSHQKQRQPPEEELVSTDNEGASTSCDGTTCPLPPWRVENFLVCELQAEHWHCRGDGEDETTDSKDTFLNRGKELWHSTREAWLERNHTYYERSKPLSEKGTRELIDFMKAKEGAHPLPRRIPLSIMVRIYTEHVWDNLYTSCDVCDVQHV